MKVLHYSHNVIKNIKYEEGFENMDIIQSKAFAKLCCSFSIMFSRFPSRTQLDYTQDLIEVRNNLRFLLQNPDYATDQDLRQEKFGNLSLQYRDIYRAKQSLTDENYTKCVEHCFDKFREGVEQYKLDFKAKQEAENAEKIRQKIEYRRNKLREVINKSKLTVKKMESLIEEGEYDDTVRIPEKENTPPEQTRPPSPTKWQDFVSQSNTISHFK